MQTNINNAILNKLLEIAKYNEEEKKDFLNKYQRLLSIEILTNLTEGFNEEEKNDFWQKMNLEASSTEQLTAYLDEIIEKKPELKEKVKQAVEKVMGDIFQLFQQNATPEENKAAEEWLKQQSSLNP